MSKYYLLQFPFIARDKWEPIEVELTTYERLTTCTVECMGYVRIIDDGLRQAYCEKFQTEGECTHDFTKYILRKNAEHPIDRSNSIHLSEFINFFSKHLYKNYITIVELIRPGDIGHSVTVYKDNSHNIWILDPQVKQEYVCILNPDVEEEKRTDDITDYFSKADYIGFSIYFQSNKRLRDKNITREEIEFEPGKKPKILSRAEYLQYLQESLAKYLQDSQVQDLQSSQVEPETKQTTISWFPSNLNEEPALFSMGKPSKTRNNRKKHKGTNKKKVGNGKTKKQKTKTKKPKTKTKKSKN